MLWTASRRPAAAATTLRVALAAHPVVGGGPAGGPRRVVGKVRELAHHEVGGEGRGSGAQALGVVGVADHGLRPEALELRDPRGRARHGRDRVARRDEERDDAEADHAGGPGDEQAHAQAAAASTSGNATTPA